MYHTERDASKPRSNPLKLRGVNISGTGEITPLEIESEEINEFLPRRFSSARTKDNGEGRPIRSQMIAAPLSQRMFENNSLGKGGTDEIRGGRPQAGVVAASIKEQEFVGKSFGRNTCTPSVGSFMYKDGDGEQRVRLQTRETTASSMEERTSAIASRGRHDFTTPVNFSPPIEECERRHKIQAERLEQRVFEGRGRSLGMDVCPEFLEVWERQHEESRVRENIAPLFKEPEESSIEVMSEDKPKAHVDTWERRRDRPRTREKVASSFKMPEKSNKTMFEDKPKAHIDTWERRCDRPRTREKIASPFKEPEKSNKAMTEDKPIAHVPTNPRDLYPFPERIIPPVSQQSAYRNVRHYSRGRPTINTLRSPRGNVHGTAVGPATVLHNQPLRVVYNRNHHTNSAVGIIPVFCIAIALLAMLLAFWYYSSNLHDLLKHFTQWFKKRQQPKGLFSKLWRE